MNGHRWEKSRMKALCCVVFVAVVGIAGLAQGQSTKKQLGDRERLIGAWHLAHIESPGPDGKTMETSPAARHADLHERRSHVSAAHVSRSQQTFDRTSTCKTLTRLRSGVMTWTKQRTR